MVDGNMTMTMTGNKNKMNKDRIEKYTGKEPTSFVDFANNYLKEESYGNYISIVPLYVVNKSSGMMTVINTARVDVLRPGYVWEYCNIAVIKNHKIIAQFSVKDEDKYKNKLINIKWGSFYAGNYELFLNQKDAAMRSKEFLWNKKMKLYAELNMLDNLIE